MYTCTVHCIHNDNVWKLLNLYHFRVVFNQWSNFFRVSFFFCKTLSIVAAHYMPNSLCQSVTAWIFLLHFFPFHFNSLGSSAHQTNSIFLLFSAGKMPLNRKIKLTWMRKKNLNLLWVTWIDSILQSFWTHKQMWQLANIHANTIISLNISMGHEVLCVTTKYDCSVCSSE